jgi:dipeptidyl aminopeptidase/acylaminoacyl peptidase
VASVLVGSLLAVACVAPARAAFPGRNGTIAFPVGVTNGQQLVLRDIYSVEPDGSNPVNLTRNPPGTYDENPAWSPDGRHLAFQRWVGSGKTAIWVMNWDGNGERQVTHPATGDFTPAWSPDGTKIAFARYVEPGFDIFTVATDGTGPTNLTNRPTADSFDPAWSPDGTKIAFDADGTHAIYTMNADGTGRTRLYTKPGAIERLITEAPNWSPDGSKIAFDEWDATDSAYQGRTIVMGADGSNPISLPPSAASGGDFQPAWSPDGTKLAFSHFGPQDSSVFTRRADGSHIALLFTPVADTFAGSPDWQPAPDPVPWAALDPASIAWKSFADHVDSDRRTVTLTNRGDADLIVSRVALTGPDAGSFLSSADGCTGHTVGAGQSCTMVVRFRPLGTGAKTARLEFTHNAPDTARSVALSGTGTPAPWLSISPQGVKFGHWRVGSTAPVQSVTMTNVGSATMSVSGIALQGTDPADFPGLTETCTAQGTLAPGQSCTARVAFRPTATGARTATLIVTDTAPRSPHRIGLAGTGT